MALHAMAEAGDLRAEADRLRAERDELRRWKSTHAPRLDALEGLLHAAQAKAVAGDEAIATLASERAANSILTGDVDGLRNERDAALAELAQAREVLIRLEWDSWGYDPHAEGRSHCPCCGWTKDEGHAPDCALNAALAAKGE